MKNSRDLGKCIYCKVALTKRKKTGHSDSQQSDEHVFSKHLGFRETIPYVCRGCNNRFNNEFENYALLNSILGIISNKFTKKKRNNNLKEFLEVTVAHNPEYGIFQGLNVRFDDNNCLLPLNPQIGYYNNTGKIVYLTQEQIINDGLSDEQLALIEKNHFYYGDMRSVQELHNWLTTEKSLLIPPINFNNYTTCDRYLSVRSDLQFKFEFIFFYEFKKLIIKFAFNFLTYILGPQFALLNAFDNVRSLLLYNQGNIDDFFKVKNNYYEVTENSTKIDPDETGLSIFVLFQIKDTIICRLQFYSLPTIEITLAKNALYEIIKPFAYYYSPSLPHIKPLVNGSPFGSEFLNAIEFLIPSKAPIDYL